MTRLDAPPPGRRLDVLPDVTAIDRALGLLIGQRGCSTAEARQLLAQLAVRQERRAPDVARDLLAQAAEEPYPWAALPLTYAELGRALAADSADGAVRRVSEMAVERIAGADWASVVLRRRGGLTTVAATHPTAEAADQLQQELHEGPSVAVLGGMGAALATHLAEDRRWSAFAARASGELGVEAVMALRVSVDPDDLDGTSGCLNVYSAAAGFTPESVVAATLLAAHASTALVASHSRRQREHLEEALHSNREIGMAIGILMDQHKITRERAFSLLRTASQQSNRKLRAIAADVVDTGTLPDDAH